MLFFQSIWQRLSVRRFHFVYRIESGTYNADSLAEGVPFDNVSGSSLI